MPVDNGTRTATTSEQAQRVAYCKQHNIHHLLELLATRVLAERPANPFAYLRQLLTSVEASTQRHGVYDATRIPSPPPSSLHDDNDDDDKDDCSDEAAAAAAVTTTATTTKREGGDNADTAASSSSPSPRTATATTNTTTTTPTTTRHGAGDDDKPPVTRYKITLGMFGLDNAGKTSVLSQLEGDVCTQTTPTIGFTPAQFQTADSDVYLFDLGGASNFRGIWQHYYHDCYGVVFVLDSAADEAVVRQSLRVLRETLTHPCMCGKPVLVLANKKDLAGSRGVAVMPPSLLDEVLPPHTPRRVVATCAIAVDAAIEDGVEWLLHAVRNDYAALRRRVDDDTARVRAEKARARAEQMAQLHKEE